MKRSLLLVVMLAGTMACTPVGSNPTTTTTPAAAPQLREVYLPPLGPGIGTPASLAGLTDLEVDASRYPAGATIEAKGNTSILGTQAETYCLSISIDGSSTPLTGSEVSATKASGFPFVLTTKAVPLPQGVSEYRLASTCDGNPCSGAFNGMWTRIRW